MPYTPEQNALRQEALYRFLLRRGDEWTSMEETTRRVELYPHINSNYHSHHNSSARRLLTRDIEKINASDNYEKIIISGNRGIKIADENEFRAFLRSELREIFAKLRRVRQIARKGSRDQQIDIEGRIAQAFLRRD